MVKHNIVPALTEIILQFKHTKLNVAHVRNMNNYIQSNMSLLTRPPFLISQASFATFHPSLLSPPSPPIFPPPPFPFHSLPFFPFLLPSPAIHQGVS